jgi:hypothetical protein
MKPLSRLQKSTICQIARRAFDKLTASNKITGITFDDWRREECERATGLPGLRACGNDHYSVLASHFESLSGEDGRALNHLLADATNKRRQLEHVLLATLKGAELPITFAERIAQDKFKCGVMDASDEHLRAILITCKARIAARRRKGVRSLNSQPSTLS